MKTQTNRFRRTLGCFLNLPALLCLALVSAILISCTTTQHAPVTLAVNHNWGRPAIGRSIRTGDRDLFAEGIDAVLEVRSFSD